MDNNQFNNNSGEYSTGSDSEATGNLFPQNLSTQAYSFNFGTHRYAVFSDYWPLFLGVIPVIGPFIPLGFMIYWCFSSKVKQETPCMSNMFLGMLLSFLALFVAIVVFFTFIIVIAIIIHTR